MSSRDISVQISQETGQLKGMHQKVGAGITSDLKLSKVGAKSEREIRHSVVKPLFLNQLFKASPTGQMTG